MAKKPKAPAGAEIESTRTPEVAAIAVAGPVSIKATDETGSASSSVTEGGETTSPTDNPRATEATTEPAAGSTPAAGDPPASPRFFRLLSPVLLDGEHHDVGDLAGLYPHEIAQLQAAGVLGDELPGDDLGDLD